MTALALLAGALLARPQLLVHTSAVDITPPERLPLGGYTERLGKLMVPGGDPLYARTLLFERGAAKVAVVSVETLTIPESLAREVRKRLPTGVQLFLHAVHTHCAPDSQMLNDRMRFAVPGIAQYNPLWLGWYASKITESIDLALASPGFPLGRLSLKVGHVGLNRPRRRGGDPDSASRELVGGGKLLFTEYAAHATIYGPDELHTRGDWPGAVAQATSAPVLVGAIGDVSPAVDGGTAPDRVRRFRDRLIDSFRGVRARTVWKSRDRIGLVEENLPLDKPRPHPTFASTYKVPEALAKALVLEFTPAEATITAFRLGSLAIIGIPGEPTGALGNRIVDAGRDIGFDSVIVCSHVNGWIGYILEPRDYDRGGYEATLSFNGRMQGERTVEAASDALQKLWDQR